MQANPLSHPLSIAFRTTVAACIKLAVHNAAPNCDRPIIAILFGSHPWHVLVVFVKVVGLR